MSGPLGAVPSAGKCNRAGAITVTVDGFRHDNSGLQRRPPSTSSSLTHPQPAPRRRPPSPPSPQPSGPWCANAVSTMGLVKNPPDFKHCSGACRFAEICVPGPAQLNSSDGRRQCHRPVGTDRFISNQELIRWSSVKETCAVRPSFRFGRSGGCLWDGVLPIHRYVIRLSSVR
jgi:hypothetical protein